jgi:hypothetical protein
MTICPSGRAIRTIRRGYFKNPYEYYRFIGLAEIFFRRTECKTPLVSLEPGLIRYRKPGEFFLSYLIAIDSGRPRLTTLFIQ